MNDELLLPIEAFYFAPFLVGPITCGIWAMVIANLRIWHGLLLGVFMGPATVIPTFAIVRISWASTGSDDMSAGAQRIHLGEPPLTLRVHCQVQCCDSSPKRRSCDLSYSSRDYLGLDITTLESCLEGELACFSSPMA